MHSVEVAHIYQDEPLNIDYIRSLKQSIETVQSLGLNDYSIKILIDDLHVDNEKSWGLHELLYILYSENIPVDYIAFESAFQFSKENILDFISPENLRWESFRKENKRVLFYTDGEMKFALKTEQNGGEKYTCTFLSFCWHLCRLGVIEYPLHSVLPLNNNKKIQCQKTLTLLDKKYKKIEDRVQRLLNNVVSSDRISYHYF